MPFPEGDLPLTPIAEFRIKDANLEDVAHRIEEGGLYTDLVITEVPSLFGDPTLVRIRGRPDNNAILAARRHPPQNG